MVINSWLDGDWTVPDPGGFDPYGAPSPNPTEADTGWRLYSQRSFHWHDALARTLGVDVGKTMMNRRFNGTQQVFRDRTGVFWCPEDPRRQEPQVMFYNYETSYGMPWNTAAYYSGTGGNPGNEQSGNFARVRSGVVFLAEVNNF